MLNFANTAGRENDSPADDTSILEETELELLVEDLPLSLFGMVNVSLADGFSWPKMTSTIPLAYCWPGIELKRIASLLFFHSLRRTGPGDTIDEMTLP